MKISVTQTGGFAGLSQSVAAGDTAQLDASTARKIERTIQEMGFFDLPSNIGNSVGADQFNYEVAVTEGNRHHTVTFVAGDDSPDTAPLRRLVETLRQLA